MSNFSQPRNSFNVNAFNVIGSVVQIDLTDTSREGVPAAYGTLAVKTDLAEVLINFYQSATYNSGKVNETYNILKNLTQGAIYEFQCSLDENKYVPPGSSDLVKSYRANLRFINKPREKDVLKSEFEYLGMVTQPIKPRTNQQGDVYAYEIFIGQPHYKAERGLNIFRFNVDPKNTAVLDYVTSNYTSGQTVHISGHMESVQSIVTKEEEVLFGSPVSKTYVNKVDFYYITGGKEVLAEMQFTPEQIKTLAEATKADDLQQKNKKVGGNSNSGAVASTKPASKTPVNDPFADFK